MLNKKKVILIIGFVLIFFISIFLVSARSVTEDIKSLTSGVSDILQYLAETLLGPGPEGIVGGGLFARTLFFLIVLSVVWVVIGRITLFSDKKGVIAIISISVALLSTRFLLQTEWVETVLLPYTVLGVALTAFIPFIIYFYFLEFITTERWVRKVGWIFGAVVFMGLWWNRYDTLQSDALYIYPITALLCLLTLGFDKSIQKAISKSDVEKMVKEISRKELNKQLKGLAEGIEVRHQFYTPGSRLWRDALKAEGKSTKEIEELLAKTR